jgi:putative tryptophan/tyrosine transport system substrate-binding protein
VIIHRELIIALAARHRLPAIYNGRFWAADGGLMSYGPDFVDQYRHAAGYVDRILKGEKPADLLVQQADPSSRHVDRKLGCGIIIAPEPHNAVIAVKQHHRRTG